MSDCCSSVTCSERHPKKQRCPVNGLACVEVSARTIAHHIKRGWEWSPISERYFFCDDPACDVVYFGTDDSVIVKSELRTLIGIKESSVDSALCYCFGVNKVDLQNDPEIKKLIAEKTKNGLCSCETSNPSGLCCLKDFPKTSN